ncbi:hypothetical protein CRN32_05765 [Vibrio vulnificus]|uniref:hypothetical protein n=1 Tax=Vibrio vulnificus TaxID=672 RepID=UPI000CD2ED83|nr:hypothetical protein [Vibrio vulnificus]EGQ7967165.1 hypothetical protein [Vibrio vulnificus]MDK2618339.1 hypothetical protein [Vibrio vulnificus]MDK2675064.1 hypothetical protein [Vibrio vulnificus]POC58277.1 hypothetical protein CRN32_05765 [Vibrio vulnificus]
MVHAYGAEETKAFRCNCKKVTVHKYESFSKTEPKTESRGFFSELLAAIASALMEGEPTGDYKCKVCGTNLSTPDNLD